MSVRVWKGCFMVNLLSHYTFRLNVLLIRLRYYDFLSMRSGVYIYEEYFTKVEKLMETYLKSNIPHRLNFSKYLKSAKFPSLPLNKITLCYMQTIEIIEMSLYKMNYQYHLIILNINF